MRALQAGAALAGYGEIKPSLLKREILQAVGLGGGPPGQRQRDRGGVRRVGRQARPGGAAAAVFGADAAPEERSDAA